MTTFRSFVAGLSPEARELLLSASHGGALEVAKVRAVAEGTRAELTVHGLIEQTEGLISRWVLTTFGQVARGELEGHRRPTTMVARASLGVADARNLVRDELERVGIESAAGPVLAEAYRALDVAFADLGDLVQRIDTGQV